MSAPNPLPPIKSEVKFNVEAKDNCNFCCFPHRKKKHVHQPKEVEDTTGKIKRHPSIADLTQNK